MKRPRSHVMLLTLIVCAALPATARANDGTPPWIFELIQQGDGVAITLAVVNDGEPGMAESYTLTRTDSSGSSTVFENRHFTEDDVELSQGECRGGGAGDEQCDTHPEECIDCNGDSVPECYDPEDDNWCDTVNYIHLLDECVPAGDAEYALREVTSSWDEDTETITVEDVGQDCSGGDGDGDVDADADGDGGADADADADGGEIVTTEGGSSGGCVAAASGPSDPALLVSLLMLGLGLAAMKLGSGGRR